MGEKAKNKKKDNPKKERQIRLFPANKKGKHVMHLLNFLRILLYPVHYIVYPFKMFGNKKVGNGACIYVGNHYCMWDIFYPAHTTWEGVHFLAKESLLHKPVLRFFGRKLGAVGAMRDGTDVRTLMDSMKILKNGEKLSLFPEGTRNKLSDEEFLPFRGGSALLAIKTQTPVIPFVICNRPKVFRKTHVVFGEPIEFTEFYGKKLRQEDYDAAETVIRDKLYEMRNEHRKYLAAKKKGKK